jgi:hypothetical protein
MPNYDSDTRSAKWDNVEGLDPNFDSLSSFTVSSHSFTFDQNVRSCLLMLSCVSQPTRLPNPITHSLQPSRPDRPRVEVFRRMSDSEGRHHRHEASLPPGIQYNNASSHSSSPSPTRTNHYSSARHGTEFSQEPEAQQQQPYYYSNSSNTKASSSSSGGARDAVGASYSGESHNGAGPPPLPLTSYGYGPPQPYSYSNDYGGEHMHVPGNARYHATADKAATSFESSTTSGGTGVVPQMVVSGHGSVGHHPHMYPYGPYGYPHSHYYPPPPPWAVPSAAPPEYICDIRSEDVLSGRGGATNSHSGNRVFRTLVKEYQGQYLQAKKRDKPAVASIIVELIRKKGGRFLRRSDTSPQGHVLWIDIGDERAREKCCQALREGAPELRRRKKDSSSDEDDVKRTDSMKDTEVTLTSASSTERTLSVDGKNESNRFRGWTKAEDSDAEDTRDGAGSNGPIVIRPLARLMPRRPPVEPIPLDQLSAEYRDLYLRDFLPPCPQIRKKKRKFSDRPEYDTSTDHNERGYWPVMSV